MYRLIKIIKFWSLFTVYANKAVTSGRSFYVNIFSFKCRVNKTKTCRSLCQLWMNYSFITRPMYRIDLANVDSRSCCSKSYRLTL
jgi:hypothetical protein